MSHLICGWTEQLFSCTRLPSLTFMFSYFRETVAKLPEIPCALDISGEYVYSDTTRHRMVFDMEARIPDNSEVTMAELKLYQRASYHKRFALEKKNHRPVNNARVSIYWVEVLPDGSNRTSLIDSR